MGRLFDQLKSASETLTEKSGQMIQSASELTKSFAETVSDKETYKNMGKTIQTKLTADKDEDGIPDIINNVGKGAVKLGKTISGDQTQHRPTDHHQSHQNANRAILDLQSTYTPPQT